MKFEADEAHGRTHRQHESRKAVEPFLTAIQLELLFMASPRVAPHPRFAADLDWLVSKGLLRACRDGTLRRTRAGQSLVATVLDGAGDCHRSGIEPDGS